MDCRHHSQVSRWAMVRSTGWNRGDRAGWIARYERAGVRMRDESWKPSSEKIPLSKDSSGAQLA